MTNAKRNEATHILLDNLYTTFKTATIGWILNLEKELHKYEHYTWRAAMLSDLHGYEYDEALMPTYTLVAYEDEGQYRFI